MSKELFESTSSESELKGVEPVPEKPRPEVQTKQDAPFKSDGKMCSVPCCNRKEKYLRKGLCNTHYARLKASGDIHPEIPIVSPSPRRFGCSIPGCTGKHSAKGLCFRHYHRLWQNGTTEKLSIEGDKNPKWKGGQTHHADGRVFLYRPEHPNANNWGYVFRYRLVMEKVFGRLLTEDEIVHHKNGIVDDDRPENLEVMTQSEHIKLHAKFRKQQNPSRYLCSIPGCGKKHHGKGFCQKHYDTIRARKNP